MQSAHTTKSPSAPPGAEPSGARTPGELVVTVRRSSAGEALVYRFAPATRVVGRDPGCALHLPDPAVDLQHLRFEVRDATWWAVDLGSVHGSSLRGVPLAPHQAARLRTTEVLTVGPYLLEVYLDREAGPTTHSNDTDRLARLLADEVVQRTRGLWWVWVRAGGPEDGRPVEPGQPVQVAGAGLGGDLVLSDPDLAGVHLTVQAEGAAVRVELGGAPAILTWPATPERPARRLEGADGVLIDGEALLHVGPAVLRLAPPAAGPPSGPVGRAPTASEVLGSGGAEAASDVGAALDAAAGGPGQVLNPTAAPGAAPPGPGGASTLSWTRGERWALWALAALGLAGLGLWLWG